MLGGLVDHSPKPRVALEAAEAHRVATVPRLYLAYISPVSPLDLAHISPISRLHLADQVAAAASGADCVLSLLEDDARFKERDHRRAGGGTRDEKRTPNP